MCGTFHISIILYKCQASRIIIGHLGLKIWTSRGPRYPNKNFGFLQIKRSFSLPYLKIRYFSRISSYSYTEHKISHKRKSLLLGRCVTDSPVYPHILDIQLWFSNYHACSRKKLSILTGNEYYRTELPEVEIGFPKLALQTLREEVSSSNEHVFRVIGSNLIPRQILTVITLTGAFRVQV